MAAPPSVDDGLIKSGDWAVAYLKDDRRLILKVQAGETFKAVKLPGRGEVDLGSAVGLRWNEPIGYDQETRMFCPLADENEAQKQLVEKMVRTTAGDGDNRNLLDRNHAQTLTSEEVIEKRQAAKQGIDVVEALISGSKTFSNKTKFSQEKYITKKSKKYDFSMRLRKPTIDSVIEAYSNKKPDRILNIRADTISQMLSVANIAAGSTTLVLDGVAGLLTASTVLRQGGAGRIYCVGGTAGKGVPTSQQFEWLGVTDEAAQSLVNFHFQRDFAEELRDAPAVPFPVEDDVTDERRRDYRTQLCAKKVVHHLRSVGGADSVIIASQHDPREAFLQLLPLMGGSCSFCIYSRYIEPLIELSQQLRSSTIAVNVQLSETWFREYQVLPNRTHPTVNMNATGGFILSGTVVENAHPRSFWSVTDSFSQERNRTESGVGAPGPPRRRGKAKRGGDNTGEVEYTESDSKRQRVGEEA
eukprot:TRINITY_DN24313_c0_g1_i2.p1 TRINITY_DN24313_c0_g1~~TRINITY_DN24313_c0_g1_i2.p1  ORF type:complete len:471 (+),score=198.73 TRINITY_DN24313_c0_g1_i2:108-1520(+)